MHEWIDLPSRATRSFAVPALALAALGLLATLHADPLAAQESRDSFAANSAHAARRIHESRSAWTDSSTGRPSPSRRWERRPEYIHDMPPGDDMYYADDFDPADEEFFDGDSAGDPEWVDQAEEDSVPDAVIWNGFVFINGQFVAPPYRLEFAEGKVLVNAQEIHYGVDPRGHAAGYGGRARFGGRFHPVSRRMESWQVRRLERELEDYLPVVELPGQAAVSLTQPVASRALLEFFAGNKTGSEVSAELLDYIPEQQHEAWRTWLTSYQPPAELERRAADQLAGVDAREASNRDAINAVRRLDHLAYPLTIIGMICVVLAVGHLLMHRPADLASADNPQLTPEIRRLVTRSMLLVIVLSGLDLAWTILASQAGQMRELNPIGSRMIEDPLALVAFKTSMTCMSVGLIFGLRKHRPAQVASWWALLICTLLTVRWLVFNSMFVA